MFAANLGIKLVESVLPLGSIVITKFFIDSIGLLLQGEGSLFTSIGWISLQAGFMLAISAISKVNMYLFTKWGMVVHIYCEKVLIDKVTAIPLEQYDRADYHDTLQRVSAGFGYRGLALISAVMEMVKSVITITGCIAILVTLHWMFIIVIVLVALPSLLGYISIGRREYDVFVNLSAHERISAYLSTQIMSKEAAKEVRIYNHTSYLKELWENTVQLINLKKLKLEKKNHITRFLIESFDKLMEIAIVSGVLLIVLYRKLSIGDFMAFFQTISTVRSNVDLFAAQLGVVFTESLFIHEFLRFLEEKESVHAGKLSFPEKLERGIEVNQLCFTYPDSSRRTLHDISFTIKPGQKVAIVGDNGAGKSTLVKCLLGLYRNTEGEVLYDGVPIQEFDRTQFSRNISAIFQDYVKYCLSLKENIAVSNTDYMKDIDLIRMAAYRAGALEFIEALPEQLHTVPSAGVFGGADLSSGQWQRVALSRALFRNSQVIVLDEPTSAMDPIAESKLFEKFLEITEGKTAIFVTHRLGSCSFADLILVLKKGRLVQAGTHQQLMQQQGEYRFMYTEQSKWYSSEERASS